MRWSAAHARCESQPKRSSRATQGVIRDCTPLGKGQPASPAKDSTHLPQCLETTRFPKTQSTTLRTTNTIERLHEEFRRRVKTQGSLPTEDAALVLLFSLVASGQIKLRKIDGWQKIGAVLNQHTALAA